MIFHDVKDRISLIHASLSGGIRNVLSRFFHDKQWENFFLWMIRDMPFLEKHYWQQPSPVAFKQPSNRCRAVRRNTEHTRVIAEVEKISRLVN